MRRISLHVQLLLLLLLLELASWACEAAVVSYTLVAAPYSWRPDGVNFTGLAYNGQVPGPVLRAVKGDTLRVTVVNNLEGEEGTSLHFHGVAMMGNAFADGTPWVSQCPIRPGESFEYVFTVPDAGTFWYHSHSGHQRGEGLFGALIVEDHSDPYAGQYDDELLLIVQDWYHHPVDRLMQSFIGHLPEEVRRPFLKPGPIIPPSSVGGGLFRPNGMLANGKHKFDCSKLKAQGADNATTCDESAGRFEVFHVKPGRTYRLRVICASFALDYRLFIDGHEFNVIGTDGFPVALSPSPFASLFLTSGETYDLLLTANRPAGRYWLRACVPWPSLPDCANPQPLAILNYEGADEGKEPTTVPEPFLEEREVDAFKLKAHATTEPPPPEAAEEGERGKGLKQLVLQSKRPYEINDTQFMNEKLPLMFRASLRAAASEVPIVNPIYSFPVGSTVLLIFNNLMGMNHPLHIHGHTAWLAGQGRQDEGPFNAARDWKRLRLRSGPDAPLRKHSVLVRTRSWVALLYTADNPGYWLFHCHMDPHMMVGMSVVLYDEPTNAAEASALAVPRGFPTWCVPKASSGFEGGSAQERVTVAVAVVFGLGVAAVLGVAIYRYIRKRQLAKYGSLT